MDHDWTYSSANEITQHINSIDGTAGYTSDDLGQLTWADYDYQTDESYTYDDNGNRTAKFVDTDGVLDAGDTDITTYTWDYRNRLTGVVQMATYGGAVAILLECAPASFTTIWPPAAA